MTTHCLSDQLQCIELDIGKATNIVRSTQSTLKDFRSDSEWAKIYKYAKDVANVYKIHEVEQRPRQTRNLPRRFYDNEVFVDAPSINFCSDADDNSGDHLKTSFYYPVSDTMLNELSRRFSDEALELMSSSKL